MPVLLHRAFPCVHPRQIVEAVALLTDLFQQMHPGQLLQQRPGPLLLHVGGASGAHDGHGGPGPHRERPVESGTLRSQFTVSGILRLPDGIHGTPRVIGTLFPFGQLPRHPLPGQMLADRQPGPRGAQRERHPAGRLRHGLDDRVRSGGPLVPRDPPQQEHGIRGGQRPEDTRAGPVLGHEAAQPVPARHQDEAPGRSREQRNDLGVGMGVVQDDHHAPVGRTVAEQVTLPRLVARHHGGRHAEPLQEPRQHVGGRERRAGRRAGQIHEQDPVGKPLPQRVRALNGHGRLPDAARPGEGGDHRRPRHGAGAVQQGSDPRGHVLAVREGRGRRRQHLRTRGTVGDSGHGTRRQPGGLPDPLGNLTSGLRGPPGDFHQP